MIDLADVLAAFDRLMTIIELETERMLVVYGATPEEIEAWRQTELVHQREVAAKNREGLISGWFADASVARQQSSPQ